jgi:hypothetical protein
MITHESSLENFTEQFEYVLDNYTSHGLGIEQEAPQGCGCHGRMSLGDSESPCERMSVEIVINPTTWMHVHFLVLITIRCPHRALIPSEFWPRPFLACSAVVLR